MYQCVVWHRSWLMPQSLNVTVFENKPRSVMIYVTIIGLCILLFSVIVCGLWKWKRLTTSNTGLCLRLDVRCCLPSFRNT
ncbi:rCG54099 [Rattus norvegicus]|uniref:RCG54099 n=1 Tax=Rattus norvegicus TaxID=10116 RepID=A6JBB0_RAT|nr:rCG54099 [Rattus norvegicus]